MKKLLALLLALVMVLSMAACSDSDDKDDVEDEEITEEKGDGEETLVGTWACELDMSNYMKEYMASDGTGYEEYMKFEDLTAVVQMTFKEDGTAVCSLDEASAQAMRENIQKTMADGMLKMVEEQLTLANPGSTLEEALATTGMTMDELTERVNTLFDADYILDNLTGGFISEGKYTVDGDKLYRFDGEDKYDVFELDGDTLTLTDRGGSGSEDDAAMVAEFYPMVFTRVDE